MLVVINRFCNWWIASTRLRSIITFSYLVPIKPKKTHKNNFKNTLKQLLLNCVYKTIRCVDGVGVGEEPTKIYQKIAGKLN